MNREEIRFIRDTDGDWGIERIATAKAPWLCSSITDFELPELKGRKVAFMVMAKKKPDHKQYFNIRAGGMADNHDFTDLVHKMLRKKYKQGFRYVWAEYEERE